MFKTHTHTSICRFFVYMYADTHFHSFLKSYYLSPVPPSPFFCNKKIPTHPPPPSLRTSRKWVIYFQGGGWCAPSWLAHLDGYSILDGRLPLPMGKIHSRSFPHRNPEKSEPGEKGVVLESIIFSFHVKLWGGNRCGIG